MKAHGKGQGLDINDKFTNNVNKFKQVLSHVSDGVPAREFVPLKVKPHPRQADMDAIRAIPSLVH